MTDKKKEQKIDWRVVCTGIVCLSVIEIVALMNGINGTVLSAVLAAIALAIGISIQNPFKKN